MVHRDEFLAEGTDPGLDRLDAVLKGSMEINIFPRIGPGHRERERCLLGRTVRFVDGYGCEYYEAGSQYAGDFRKAVELGDEAKPLAVPGLLTSWMGPGSRSSGGASGLPCTCRWTGMTSSLS